MNTKWLWLLAFAAPLFISGCGSDNDRPVLSLPVDDTPVDDTPVDDTPVDDTPVDDTPVDDTPEPEPEPQTGGASEEQQTQTLTTGSPEESGEPPVGGIATLIPLDVPEELEGDAEPSRVNEEAGNASSQEIVEEDAGEATSGVAAIRHRLTGTVPNHDYLRYGAWLNLPDKSVGYDFPENGELFTVGQLESVQVGEATYQGGAVGHYMIDQKRGSYKARANLTARFMGPGDGVEVAGTISNFDENGGNPLQGPFRP